MSSFFRSGFLEGICLFIFEESGRGKGNKLRRRLTCFCVLLHVETPCSKQPLRLLTKGDNNLADDTELYAKGQDYLTRSEDIIGSVVGYVPFVGYVTIVLSEHPWLKKVLLGIMGVMVVLQRE